MNETTQIQITDSMIKVLAKQYNVEATAEAVQTKLNSLGALEDINAVLTNNIKALDESDKQELVKKLAASTLSEALKEALK